MRKNIILLAIVALIAACTDPKTKLFNQIKDLEQSDSLSTPEGLKQLSELHAEYGMKYHDSLANQYLYSAAMFRYYSDDKQSAKPLLVEYIYRPDSSIQMRNSLFALADLYYADDQLDSFEKISDELMDNYVPTPQQFSVLAKLFDDRITNGKDADVKDYERLSTSFTALGAHKMALMTIDTALVQFPKAPNRAKMIYRAGFIAWDYLQDPLLAEKYYNQFVLEFPEHELAAEVKDILESGKLRMTDEQILEMIRSKSGA